MDPMINTRRAHPVGVRTQRVVQTSVNGHQKGTIVEYKQYKERIHAPPNPYNGGNEIKGGLRLRKLYYNPYDEELTDDEGFYPQVPLDLRQSNGYVWPTNIISKADEQVYERPSEDDVDTIQYRLLFAPLRVRQEKLSRVFTPNDLCPLEAEIVKKARRTIEPKDSEDWNELKPVQQLFVCNTEYVRNPRWHRVGFTEEDEYCRAARYSVDHSHMYSRVSVSKPKVIYSYGRIITPTKYRQRASSPVKPEMSHQDIDNQVKTNRRRSHVLNGRVDDSNVENISAVVIGKASVESDKVDAATDVIQTGDGKLYHGRARSRTSDDTVADAEQQQAAIVSRRQSRARSITRNEQNSSGYSGRQKDSSSMTQFGSTENSFDHRDEQRTYQTMDNTNNHNKKEVCVCHCQTYNGGGTVLSVPHPTNEKGVTAKERSMKTQQTTECHHKTKMKLTQVPVAKAHLGQQFPGTISDPDIIERSQWSVIESPDCYIQGQFSPTMEDLKKNKIKGCLYQPKSKQKDRDKAERRCRKTSTTPRWQTARRRIKGSAVSDPRIKYRDTKAKPLICKQIKSEDLLADNRRSIPEKSSESMCDLKVSTHRTTEAHTSSVVRSSIPCQTEEPRTYTYRPNAKHQVKCIIRKKDLPPVMASSRRPKRHRECQCDDDVSFTAVLENYPNKHIQKADCECESPRMADKQTGPSPPERQNLPQPFSFASQFFHGMMKSPFVPANGQLTPGVNPSQNQLSRPGPPLPAMGYPLSAPYAAMQYRIARAVGLPRPCGGLDVPVTLKTST